MNKSIIKSHIGPRQVARFDLKPEDVTYREIDNLNSIGICFDASDIAAIHAGIGMDADPTSPLTTGSITTPVQFAQAWLPGSVQIVTSPRRIDLLVGITTQGDWADEEIVQSIIGNSGTAPQYVDQGNIPLANWNLNFETRTIVRYEMGLNVGILETERASKVRTSNAAEKRYGVIQALEIARNNTGFFGFNDGANNTFGLLNDPELSAFESFPDPGAGTEWANKDFLQIVDDLRAMTSQLRIQSEGIVDAFDPSMNITLALALASTEALSEVSQFGNSVRDFIEKTWPTMRIVSVPQFDEANGGENVIYMYAEEIDNSGTDDSRVFIQVVPAKMRSLGVEQRSKSYLEDYSNATAGILTKRPYAVTRWSGA